jgi:hypothetical protein
MKDAQGHRTTPFNATHRRNIENMATFEKDQEVNSDTYIRLVSISNTAERKGQTNYQNCRKHPVDGRETPSISFPID